MAQVYEALVLADGWHSLKYGLGYINHNSSDHALAVADIARAAEDAGFDSIWVSDHVAFPASYQSRNPYSADGLIREDDLSGIDDPFTVLSYLGGITSTLLLGTAVLVLPRHDPVDVANSVATLDRLTRGRVILGVGAGWLREEFELLGYPWQNRFARLETGIGQMRALWEVDQSDPLERARQGPLAKLAARPPNRRIPIIIGGHSPAAAARAARLGDGFFPSGPQPLLAVELMRATATEIGRDPASIEVTIRHPQEPHRVRDMAVDRIVVPWRTRPGYPESLSSFDDLRRFGVQFIGKAIPRARGSELASETG